MKRAVLEPSWEWDSITPAALFDVVAHSEHRMHLFRLMKNWMQMRAA